MKETLALVREMERMACVCDAIVGLARCGVHEKATELLAWFAEREPVAVKSIFQVHGELIFKVQSPEITES